MNLVCLSIFNHMHISPGKPRRIVHIQANTHTHNGKTSTREACLHACKPSSGHTKKLNTVQTNIWVAIYRTTV